MYSKGLIYKLCCKDPEITAIYVGSTINLKNRKNRHKQCCVNLNKKYDYFVYQFIRENGGWENWDVILIEKYPCDTKIELHQRERFWIEKLTASLNKQIPTQTDHEYYEKNKEERLAQKKTHYEANKEIILVRQREYAHRRDVMDKRIVKIPCSICEKMISKCNMAKHMKVKHSDS